MRNRTIELLATIREVSGAGGGRRELPEGAPRPGELFADKFRIERVLGVGGMGYVLAATHVQLSERVAIKLLLPERAKQADTVARFIQEGRAAVRIRSEHVGRVLDVGSEGGVPYIVMEYLDGCDLAELVRGEGRLQVERAVDYVLQATEAIAEAHALGIVHRDLKPANLFLVRRRDGSECIKVLDFGISKMAGEGAELAMTGTAATLGTPLYMSPEQLKSSKSVDARSDLWALGVITFELVAGRPPFLAATIAELGAQVLTEDAPDVRTLVPSAPEGLARAIAACLRRRVDERVPSIVELAASLAPFGTEEARTSAKRVAQVMSGVPRPANSGALPTPSSQSLPAAAATITGVSTTASTTGISVRGRLVPALVALALVGGLGGVAVARLTRAPAPSVSSTASAPASAAEPPPPVAASAPSNGAPTVADTGGAPSAIATSSTPKASRPSPRLTSTVKATPSATHAAVTAPSPQAPTPPASGANGFSSSRFE